MVVFIGREKELAMLNQAYLKGGNSIVVLYGREQIGKTTLVKNLCRTKHMSIIRRESCLKKNRIVILKKYFFR